MTGELSKNFHGAGIGPLSKILAVKCLSNFLITGKPNLDERNGQLIRALFLKNPYFDLTSTFHISKTYCLPFNLQQDHSRLLPFLRCYDDNIRRNDWIESWSASILQNH